MRQRNVDVVPDPAVNEGETGCEAMDPQNVRFLIARQPPGAAATGAPLGLG